MHKSFWIILAGLGLLTACGPSASEASSYEALGESISEKSPHMPTTFVDTSGSKYPWDKMYNPIQSIQNRIAAPAGYKRMPLDKGSFGEWLRGLPLKPGKPQVLLFDGSPKGNQSAQFAVMNIDVGKRDLQQCADAVMRLRAEYLFSQGLHEAIHFNFTNGANCAWTEWKAGKRPVVAGSKINWVKKAEPSATHATFRSYMDQIFMYAGTASLEKELAKVGVLKNLQIGDILIHGGFPGHAVLVVDVVENDKGNRKYLLSQSYMPAQEVHILVNPADPDGGPWYSSDASDPIATPEWTFTQAELRRWK